MKKTKKLLEKLDKRIDAVKSSDDFKEMLRFFSKFHSYSFHNAILIQLQKPEASYVAGYRQWQKKFNRQVKKGEKGIAILAPFNYSKTVTEIEEVAKGNTVVEKEVEKQIKKIYFKPVYVFDISQTEGPPPPIIDISLEDNLNNLLEPLTEFTLKQDIKLEYKNITGYTDGYSNGGSIAIDRSLNDTEKINVLIHELAHEFMHCGKDKLKLSKEIRELEAESVAFVVMDRYGIEIESDKYLALYKRNYDLKESLNRIHQLSTKIIRFCDDQFESKTTDKAVNLLS